MRGYKKGKVKASSLYESVVAIAIIAIAITMGLMIFFNVTNNVSNQVIYHQLLNKVEQIRYDSNIIDEKKEKNYFFKGYNIIRRRKNKGKKRFLLEIIVLKNDKVILKKEYFLRDDEK
ncbi:hypothetical protein [Tenacibaculum sp.]|uniref:hypothetical protein n=1 Tax=Tenacibaculum sp. TaxID=1906242 RepID=UPI003D0CD605